MIGGSSPVVAEKFFLHHSIQTDSESHPASNSMGYVRDVKLTTHFNLVPRTRRL
jgi:hypothetical protein